MRNRILIPSLVALIAIIFHFWFISGCLQDFSIWNLDSSLDIIKGEASVENNQFIIQANLDSLIEIDDRSDIDQKRNDLDRVLLERWEFASSTIC